MFFSVYTLGCKLNQLETEAVTDSFQKAGFTFIPWESSDQSSGDFDSVKLSIIVINTCTVTSMAEQKARRVIRKVLRRHPESCLIITGCYAQLEKEALAALEEEPCSRQRLFIVPGEKKDRILDLPSFLADSGAAQDLMDPSILPDLIASWLARTFDSGELPDGFENRAFRFLPGNFASHSRAFLKIQDGCDNRCAYCRVNLARGKSVSFAADEALKALKALEQRGFGEAVLTGVNISQYRDEGKGLPELLDFLLSGTETIRLRLSSIEPEGIATEFIKILAHERIRPHVHLSLQSGCAKTLGRMGRNYSPGDIEQAVERIRSARQDPFLACDIIAGFPGETADEFDETFRLCKRIGFAWIHAFPFSPRPGTAAFHFPQKVSERDAAKRVELLSDLARKGRREYVNRWEGKEVEAVIERGEGLPQGYAPVVSENYLKLLFAGDPGPAAIIRCRILPEGALNQEISGILAEKSFDSVCTYADNGL